MVENCRKWPTNPGLVKVTLKEFQSYTNVDNSLQADEKVYLQTIKLFQTISFLLFVQEQLAENFTVVWHKPTICLQISAIYL